MAKRRSKEATPSKPKARGNADEYFCWLLGKGYSEANAMRMVDAKYGSGQAERDTSLGWAWKG